MQAHVCRGVESEGVEREGYAEKKKERIGGRNKIASTWSM
jgi:hypothetical protein